MSHGFSPLGHLKVLKLIIMCLLGGERKGPLIPLVSMVSFVFSLLFNFGTFKGFVFVKELQNSDVPISLYFGVHRSNIKCRYELALRSDLLKFAYSDIHLLNPALPFDIGLQILVLF